MRSRRCLSYLPLNSCISDLHYLHATILRPCEAIKLSVEVYHVQIVDEVDEGKAKVRFRLEKDCKRQQQK